MGVNWAIIFLLRKKKKKKEEVKKIPHLTTPILTVVYNRETYFCLQEAPGALIFQVRGATGRWSLKGSRNNLPVMGICANYGL